MTGDDLIAEGIRLARPCVHLKPDGDAARVAAVWRGPRQVPPPAGDYEQWITIDCRYLPNGVGPSSGCLSVYSENEELVGGAVAHDLSAFLLTPNGSQLLYAHPTISLPPLEAVFLFGSDAVSHWLAKLGWKPEWGWNGNFRDPNVANAYIVAQRTNMPVEGTEIFAVLGGWHVPWPDGDWNALIDCPLVVLTLAESEPWVEAFRIGENYKVFQRIT